MSLKKSVSLEKLANNRDVDHLEKYGLFSDFQYGFRSSGSTTDILTVASDRIARDLTGLGLLELASELEFNL